MPAREPPMKSRPDQLPRIPTPQEIHAHLCLHVIGQERAKRAIALAAYAHLRAADARRRGLATPLRKSNVLLIGPTGSGKTLLARHLAEVLGAPLAIADATEFTEAGYYGKDVELMVTELYQRAGQSVEEAERGIVFLDEVDKIARRTLGAMSGAARDIGGEGVQQALLKLLEGREVQVPSASSQPWSRHETVTIDTTNVLFVCAGTFTDLYGDLEDRHRIGFGAARTLTRRRRVRTEDLVSFGMLQELLGRLPVVVELDPLGPEELLRVLVEPEDSLVREYTERLALDGVTLALRPAALRAVVAQAISLGTGARGLRSIFEEVLGDVLFEAPTLRGGKVVVDAAFVERRLRKARAELHV